MSSIADSVSCRAVPWIAVPPGALKGQGLGPYPEGGIATLFDWVENKDAGSSHLMPHFGQFIVDIVQIEPNAVHQPSKPGDELVLVLNGVLSLITDGTKVEQIFKPGEMVMIPVGWAGLYRVMSGDGLFREFTIVPGNYFDPAAAPPPSGLSPRRLELPATAGKHELHRNRYTLEAENIDRAGQSSIDASSDEIIQVLAGTLRLTAADESASFGPGSVVILPKGFAGTAETTAGYRALNARWIG